MDKENVQMNFDIIGISNLTMVDRDTGEEFDLGECEPFTFEQEISAVEEPQRKIGWITRFRERCEND